MSRLGFFGLLIGGVGGGGSASKQPPNLSQSALAGSDFMWPLSYSNNTARRANIVQHAQVPLGVQGGSNPRFRFCNFLNLNGGAVSTGCRTGMLRASLFYNNIVYPLYFSGQRDVSEELFSDKVSDPLPNVSMNPGDTYKIIISRAYDVGTTIPWGNYCRPQFGEMTYYTDDNTDWTDGSHPHGAEVSATLTGNTITALTRLAAGTGFVDPSDGSAGFLVWAEEMQADGSMRRESVGFGSAVSGGISNTIFLESITPSKRDNWTSPRIYVTPNSIAGLSYSQPFHGCVMVTLTPSNTDYVNLVIQSDSIHAQSTVDTVGDRNGHHNVIGRGLSVASGTYAGCVNIGTPGAYASGYAGSAFQRVYDVLGDIATHVYVLLGTNDGVNGAETQANIRGYINTCANRWRALGRAPKVRVATTIPRTDSSNVPLSGFGIGEKMDLLNAEIRAGTAVVSDGPCLDLAKVWGDPANDRIWRSDWGAGLTDVTSDYVHPNYSGVVRGTPYYFINSADARGSKGIDTAVPGPVMQWDATIPASYPGSGQNIYNIIDQAPYIAGHVKADYDGYLGNSSGANSTDPVFSNGAFVNDGGDYLSQKQKTAFLNALHKTTGGTDWTIGIACNTNPANATPRSLFKSADTILSAHFGINIERWSNLTDVSQRGDTSRVFAAPAGVPSGQGDYLFIFSYKASTNTLYRWVNSDTAITATLTFNTCSSDIGESYMPLWGALAASDKLYACFMDDKAWNNAEAKLARAQISRQHNRVY